MHDAALVVFKDDDDICVRATGRPPPASAYDVTELTGPGLVFQNSRVKVTATRADHAPFEVALAYRFDSAQRSVVFSDDTAYSERIVELAAGADVLVHEAMMVSAIEQMRAARPYVPPGLREFMLQGHTSAADVGRVAPRAGVKTLVLSHLLPGDTALDNTRWIESAAAHFSGNILIAHDLMVG